MSVTFEVRIGRRVPLATLDPGIPDLRWEPHAPPDLLAPGEWGAFRDGISTRVTAVTFVRRKLTVTVRAGASVEDCDLALGMVRRVAESGDRVVNTDRGAIPLERLEEVYDDRWKRDQLESAARVTIEVVRTRGPMKMPGPGRSVVIGPRCLEILESADPGERGDRLTSLMRSVLWPDPRYEGASEFAVTARSGERYSLAIVVPDRPCILPPTDRIAIEDGEGVFTIPRSALDALPVAARYLDDGNQLLEAIDGEAWGQLTRAARAFAIEDR